MNNQQPSAPAPAPTAEAAPHRIAFVMPPPVTFFVQFQDGMQMAITPTPTPIVVNGAGLNDVAVMMPGLLGSMLGGLGFGANANGDDGMMQILHQLFMQAQQQNHGPPPTSKSFLEKLPVKIWTDESKAVERQDECPICISDFEAKDQVISLPCGHLFHKDCGMQWLKDHNVCPTCRYKMPTQQEENTAASNANGNATTASAQAQTQAPAQVQAPVATPAPAPAPIPTPIQTTAEPTPARQSRTRPRSPVMSPIRVVRRRVETSEPTPEPTPSAESEDDDAALERMLEEEATRLVDEERQAEQVSAMELDSAMEQDAESLLQGNNNDHTN